MSPQARSRRREPATAVRRLCDGDGAVFAQQFLEKQVQILVPFPKHSRLSNKTSLILASPCFGYTFEKTVHRTVFLHLPRNQKIKHRLNGECYSYFRCFLFCLKSAFANVKMELLRFSAFRFFYREIIYLLSSLFLPLRSWDGGNPYTFLKRAVK